MGINNRTKTLVVATLLIGSMTAPGYAEQWNGPGNPNGTIWRPGNVALGFELTSDGKPPALLEIRRPLSGEGELLFSLRSVFKDATSDRFEVDTKHVYAGGARSKENILPGDYDFAVHRAAAIGVVNINETIPSGYKLVVGGKILAEEVRIKLIKDWADYVFQPDYRLTSLPEVETFVHRHRHLPDMPSAAEVEQAGVSLGEMQAKLLLKIEELTLHMIEQHKAIATLQEKLGQLEQDHQIPPPNGGR
jgi:hypothetical protein